MGERAALVKFGTCEHVSQLRDKGLLYMNNLPYFWKIEDCGLRGDECDSVYARHIGSLGTLKSPDGQEHVVTGWTFREHPPQPEKINIFCMYAQRESNLPLDKRNYQFGDHALVVTNAREFIMRVGSHLDHNAMKCEANLVEYVDDNHSGPLGPFRKRNRFAYQSEWRVVCYDGPGGIRRIEIGSIRDISFVVPCTELNTWVEQVAFA
jgi:hypothetical protein